MSLVDPERIRPRKATKRCSRKELDDEWLKIARELGKLSGTRYPSCSKLVRDVAWLLQAERDNAEVAGAASIVRWLADAGMGDPPMIRELRRTADDIESGELRTWRKNQ